MALTKTYIGVNDVAKLDPELAEEAIDHAEKGLFPIFNRQVYDDVNNKRFVEYLDYISKNGNENNSRRSLDEERPFNILDILKPAKPAEVPTYEGGEAWYDTDEQDINPRLVLINLGHI